MRRRFLLKDGRLPDGTSHPSFPPTVTQASLEKAVRECFAEGGAITALQSVSLAETSHFGWFETLCTDRAAALFLRDGRLKLGALGSWAVVAQQTRGVSSEADADCRVTISREYFASVTVPEERGLQARDAAWRRRDVLMSRFQRTLQTKGVRVFFNQSARSLPLPPLTSTAYPMAGPREMKVLLEVMRSSEPGSLLKFFSVERNPVAVAMEAASDGSEATLMAEPAMIEGHADGDLLVTHEEVKAQILANATLCGTYPEVFSRPHLISSFEENNIFGKRTVVIVMPGSEVDMYTIIKALDSYAFAAEACGAQTLKWGFHYRDKCGGRTRMNGPSWFGLVSADKSLRGQPGTANWMRAPNWDGAGVTMKKLADQLVADGKMTLEGQAIRSSGPTVASFATMLTPKPPRPAGQSWGNTEVSSKRSRRRRKIREDSSGSDSSGASGKPRKQLSRAFGQAGDGGDGDDEVPFDAVAALTSAMTTPAPPVAAPIVSSRDRALLTSLMVGMAEVLAPMQQQIKDVKEQQTAASDKQAAFESSLSTRLGKIDEQMAEQTRRLEDQAKADHEHQAKLAELRQQQLSRMEADAADEKAYQEALKLKREAVLRALDVQCPPSARKPSSTRKSRRRSSSSSSSSSDSDRSERSQRAARRAARESEGSCPPGKRTEEQRGRSADQRPSDTCDLSGGRGKSDKPRAKDDLHKGDKSDKGDKGDKAGKSVKDDKRDKRDKAASAGARR